MQYKNNSSNPLRDRGSLKVRGIATLNIESNSAKINVKISSQDKSLEIAKDRNTVITNRVLNSLYGSDVPKENVYSKDISATQNYDYNTNTILSYTVAQVITILVNDISKVNDIYSLVVENGANDNIYIEYTLSNPDEYYIKALKKATENAKSKAKNLAKNFSMRYNLTPYKVVEISSQLNNITQSYSTYNQDLTPGLVKVVAEIEASFCTSNM